MEDYKKRFIELAIEQQVLAFGDFTLKSGRKSPYFFNFGRFCTGDSLREVGFCYAKHIMSQGIDFDLLFGPAYKGIPLVGATAVALSEHFDRNVR